jgi:hypothetical protein
VVYSLYLALSNGFLVLDPRISYDGLRADLSDDSDPLALEHLEQCKASLEFHYETYYAKPDDTHSRPSPAPITSKPSSPQKVDFTARYCKPAREFVNELQEYFKLPQEDFATCNLVQWWAGRRSQFPNLSRLARDILSIPGTSSQLLISLPLNSGHRICRCG